jgi:hypothetical protein
LNTISDYSWVDYRRIKWNTCSDASGSDCLTPKGFTFMRWNPSEGVFIDVYNLHADAGYVLRVVLEWRVANTRSATKTRTT